MRKSNFKQTRKSNRYKGGAASQIEQVISNPAVIAAGSGLAPAASPFLVANGLATGRIGASNPLDGLSAPHANVSTPDATAQQQAIGQVYTTSNIAQDQAKAAQAQANAAAGNINNVIGQQFAQAQNLPGAQNQVNQSIGTLQNAANQGIPQAQQNVQNSYNLQQQTAQGGGPAQQAAQAQLTAGNSQAIAAQHALANSGNLSQMIGGQYQALQNQAQLSQQNANQAAQLQAAMSANAQGQLGQTANSQLSNALGAGSSAVGAANTNLAANIGNLNAAGGNAGALLGTTASQQAANQSLALEGSGAALGGQQQIANQFLQAQLGQAQAVTAGNSAITGLVGGALGGAAQGAGGVAAHAAGLYDGGRVPGTAKSPGDSPVNDTVPTMLSPGEIVISREDQKSFSSAVMALMQHMDAEPSDEDIKALFKSKKKDK